MTTSPALPPSGDAVTPVPPSARSRAASAGDQQRLDPQFAPAHPGALPGDAVTRVLDVLAPPARPAPPERAGQAPEPAAAGDEGTSVARAREAEARLRAENAAYQGVRSVLTASSGAAERAASRRDRDEQPASAHDQDGSAREHRRERDAARENAEAAVVLARIDHMRADLARLSEQAAEAARTQVARINELAGVVAQENAARRSWRGNAEHVADEELSAVLDELTELAGARTRTARDGTLTVDLAGHALVSRSEAEPVEFGPAQPDDPGADAAGTDLPAAPGPERRFQVSAAGQAADGIGGRLGGVLAALNTVLPDAARALEDIAVVARAEATLRLDPAPPADGQVTPPDAAGLLAGLTAVISARAEAAARRLDCAAAVSAILAGPPAGFYAGMVASSSGPVPAGTGPASARAAQNLITDLQQFAASVRGVGEVAGTLAEARPFVPLSVTSSDPDLVRVDNRWPVPAGPDEAGESAEGRSPAWAIDPDVLTAPLEIEVSVVAVARGDIVISRGGVPAGADLAGGNSITLALGTLAGPGAERGEPFTEVVIQAPATLGTVAEMLTAAASAAGRPVAAGVQLGEDGLAHLIVESQQGPAWVAAVRAGGPARDILGGFSLLAPRTGTVAVSTSNGLGWSGTSEDTSLDGPIPGLAITLAPGAEGRQVTLTVRPAVDELIDSVEALAVSAGQVIASLSEGGPASGAGALSPVAGAMPWPQAPPAASPLAQDAAAAQLAAALTAAVAGTPGVPGRPGMAVPGVVLHADAFARTRLTFDREAFAAALTEDPGGTRTAVRAAAAEVAATAREALDARIGLLAVRLTSEQMALREAGAPSAAPQWDRDQRQAQMERRSAALSSLLDRLNAESAWLRRELP